jgi:hypothetical protein
MRKSPGKACELRIVQSQRDRRRSARLQPEQVGFCPAGLLRPGLGVTIMNISRGGALVASPGPLRPEAAADLLLRSDEGQYAMHGRVAHCWVDSLAPLRFLSRVVFEGETGRVPDLEATPAYTGEIVIDLRDLV